MKLHDFRGKISSSKSHLNRLLVLRSFAPSLRIHGESRADDVETMRAALGALARGEVADCGAAGTVLRFLAFRAARIPGRHVLTGTPELFARPQRELARVLGNLGVDLEFGTTELRVEGPGWSLPADGRLPLDRSASSQFASGLLLNAWNLPETLCLHLEGDPLSEGYLRMTLSTLRAAGMDIRREGELLFVPAGSEVSAREMFAEADASSAFAAVAVAVARKERAIVSGVRSPSLQPDAIFPDLLEAMGVRIERAGGELRFDAGGATQLRPLAVDLGDCPDLFPVLAVLCGIADGESILYGAPHLAHKESNRIEKTSELLRLLAIECEPRPDGLRIRGRGRSAPGGKAIPFHPAEDHRLAMAAAVAEAAGYPLQIRKPEVVRKSFPEFWELIGHEIAGAPCAP